MISRKMIAKIKENKGFSLTSILATVVIIGVLAFPMAKWFMSTTGTIGTNEAKAAAQTEKMEMQSVIQQYWQSMIDMSYDDFQAEIASKGTKRTETLGKYDLTIEFSGDSKYANALCNVGTAAGASDRRCRRANITLVSKQNPSMVESFYATRVQPASLEAKLLKLTKDLQDEDDKFKDYDTKTEADNKYACPWDYKMNAANSACVACDAPSNWKQYRSGNCTLGTCPTGQQAKADRSGCENISCSGRTALDGDICKSCPLTGKEYYTSSSGCAKSTCPTGKKVNSAGTGCEAIVCTGRTSLSGDTCVACPLSGKQYYTSSSGCAKSTCATGKKVNSAGTGCEAITCPSGKHLEGDTCVADTPPIPEKSCADPNEIPSAIFNSATGIISSSEYYIGLAYMGSEGSPFNLRTFNQQVAAAGGKGYFCNQGCSCVPCGSGLFKAAVVVLPNKTYNLNAISYPPTRVCWAKTYADVDLPFKP